MYTCAYRNHSVRLILPVSLLPFDHTAYYQAEMGKGLHRQFVSFESLISPDEISSTKHFSNGVEREFVRADTESRQVNLDPGYISASKLVLRIDKRSRTPYLS